MSYSKVPSIEITEIVEGKYIGRSFDETDIVINFPFKDDSFFFEFINRLSIKTAKPFYYHDSNGEVVPIVFRLFKPIRETCIEKNYYITMSLKLNEVDFTFIVKPSKHDRMTVRTKDMTADKIDIVFSEIKSYLMSRSYKNYIELLTRAQKKIKKQKSPLLPLYSMAFVSIMNSAGEEFKAKVRQELKIENTGCLSDEFLAEIEAEQKKKIGKDDYIRFYCDPKTNILYTVIGEKPRCQYIKQVSTYGTNSLNFLIADPDGDDNFLYKFIPELAKIKADQCESFCYMSDGVRTTFMPDGDVYKFCVDNNCHPEVKMKIDEGYIKFLTYPSMPGNLIVEADNLTAVQMEDYVEEFIGFYNVRKVFESALKRLRR